jgi:hypothetical protein
MDSYGNVVVYSVSYMATRDDNGACLSFTSWDDAEKARLALIADGCFHVSPIW